MRRTTSSIRERGFPAVTPWRTVSVAAASCGIANVASTTAIILGESALDWLGRGSFRPAVCVGTVRWSRSAAGLRRPGRHDCPRRRREREAVYWFLTRGLGVSALLLLTASLALGVLTSVRWRAQRWPRFVTAGLHRNLTLLAIAFVALHVVTTVADGYTPIGLKDAVIPFVSPYRPIWLGLGAIAFDLLIALVVTSLLRERIGYRVWRYVHWLAYAAWPVALVHALGTGTDARLGWMRSIGAACVAVVALAVLARAWLTRRTAPACAVVRRSRR